MCWIGLSGETFGSPVPVAANERVHGCDPIPAEWAPRSGNYDATNPATVDLLKDLHAALLRQSEGLPK